MKGKLGISSLLLILSATGVAAAEPQAAAQTAAPKAGVATTPNPHAAHFDAMDTNHDGKLSRDEFQAEHNRLWQTADSNHDGSVTLQEAQAAATKLRTDFVAKRFAELDVNHDGKVTTAEAGPMPAARFQKIDSNSDGVISLEEMQKAPMDHFGGPKDHHGHRAAEGEHSATAEQQENTDANPGENFIDHIFKKVDADHDGKVTPSEIQAQPTQFEHLDTNHDGAVTREEFAQQHWFGRGGHGQGHGPGAPNAASK